MLSSHFSTDIKNGNLKKSKIKSFLKYEKHQKAKTYFLFANY